MNVLDRFLNYVKIDTQSMDEQSVIPSTKKQFDLGNRLVEELRAMGISNARIDENCYVYAHIEANTEGIAPLGFIAHMDTSPDASGANVNPRIVANYDGGDIPLNPETVLSPKDFPSLKNCVGQDLIVTDGTTLLGADDKAGVAEIMTLAETLMTNPDIKHGKICIGFTPDEEVGCGADKFDVAAFGAKFAYTVDGGELGEIEYENFNAASARITVHGVGIHPGAAKNKMVNAIHIGEEFDSMLPSEHRPEYTEMYQGFIHLHTFEGCVENARLDYIIRDHDMEKFEAKKAIVLAAAEYLNKKYGEKTVEVALRDSYYNMKEKIAPHMHLVDSVKRAMQRCGVTPITNPVRGGTDGARLSFMGLPCPNICTGGLNYHGRFEYIPVQSLYKTCEILLEIVNLTVENK